MCEQKLIRRDRGTNTTVWWVNIVRQHALVSRRKHRWMLFKCCYNRVICLEIVSESTSLATSVRTTPESKCLICLFDQFSWYSSARTRWEDNLWFILLQSRAAGEQADEKETEESWETEEQREITVWWWWRGSTWNSGKVELGVKQRWSENILI